MGDEWRSPLPLETTIDMSLSYAMRPYGDAVNELMSPKFRVFVV